MKDRILSIGETAEMLGVSVTTLRRWDETGRFPSTRTEGGQRRYTQTQIDLFLGDIVHLAKEWVVMGGDIPTVFYCETSAVFQARLQKMQDELEKIAELHEIFSLVSAVVGEIGNNSFDHNIGNWPDTPGLFFGFDISKRKVVLADRGRGILRTLQRVRPGLKDHQEALLVAFTEVLSGRAPEVRGNGLKFVRQVVTDSLIGLVFQTGDGVLTLEKDNTHILITKEKTNIPGCLAVITF